MSSPRQNGKHRVRRWLPYVGLVTLVGLIIAGFWPQPVPVETIAVSVGKLRATVNEEGKTRIKQRYTISAPVTGQLRRIPFKAGAEVKGGATIVAVIEPVVPGLLDARSRAAAEARRDAAAANLEKARTAHIFASSERRRFEKLHSDKTVSVQELEAAQMRDDSAMKEETAAAGALRQAQAELSEFGSAGQGGTGTDCAPVEVKAPTDGRVLRVLEENARVVAAGMPLVEIGDPSDLEVVVDVLSRDGAAIKPGAKVDFEEWGGTESLEGRVRLVEPAAFTKVSALGVDEQRVNVIADLVTPPERRRNLGDNFRVEARIEVWQADDVVKVPAGALFRQEDQWAAFVLTNGHAQFRHVKAGRSSGAETQILEGLKTGEQVILYPGSRVKDGQRVRPIKI
jgi:HlyD family secretion protein